MDNCIENIYKSHMKQYGIPAVVDNKMSTTIFLKEIKDSTDGVDYKYLFADKGIINQGSVISFEGNVYIALEKEENFNTSTYEKFVVRKCRDIKLVAQSKVVYGIVDSKVYDIRENQYLSLADNQIVITLNDSNYIKLNDIIEFNKKAYKIIAINDTIEGLLTLKCEYDASNTHNYTIELSTTSASIYQGETYQISGTIVKDNGTIVENPTLIYISNDETSATVDETGLITAIGVGVTTISIKYVDVEAVL